jgi:protoheme IX farnesyltransferase
MSIADAFGCYTIFMDGRPEDSAPRFLRIGPPRGREKRRLPALRDAVSLFKLVVVVPNVLAALAGYWMARSAAAAGDAAFSQSWAGAARLAVGSALTIGGACALNNCLDRNLDARMERTRDRPVAAGRIGLASAFLLASLASIAGILILAHSSRLAALIGAAGAFVYLVPYTLWIKRRSSLSSLVGALSGSTPALIGWAMATGRLSPAAWALFGTIGLWQQAHVLALSLRRSEDFRRGGLPSPAGKLGAGGIKITLALVVALLPAPLWLAVGASRLVDLSAALSASWLALCWLPLAGGVVAWARRMYAASLAWIVLFLLASLICS